MLSHLEPSIATIALASMPSSSGASCDAEKLESLAWGRLSRWGVRRGWSKSFSNDDADVSHYLGRDVWGELDQDC